MSTSNSVSPEKENLPTIEQLSKDSFMNQVSHAQQIIPALQETANASGDSDLIRDMLIAQLSHSDGIRGFFVSYLTLQNGDGVEETAELEQPLIDALDRVENQKDLIPLIYMNVIMPTAMITMHEDETLSEQSRSTAKRGLKVLLSQTRKQNPNPDSLVLLKKHFDAIISVAKTTPGENSAEINDDVDSDLIEYWGEFFEKWGYKDQQQSDIVETLSKVKW